MNLNKPRGMFMVVIIVFTMAVSCVSAGPPPNEPDASPASVESTLYPTDYVWRDMAGEPLPFQDQATILEVLRTAPVVESEVMSRGVAGNIELVLDHEDRRIRAVLRVIDRREKEETGSARMDVRYRDSHIFEAAAYELDRMLGIGRIPPTVERRVKGQPGTVQVWMEGVVPEDVMLAEGRLKPPDSKYWWQQKTIMWVFDALIANIDRNQGNLLIDDDWNLWLIDHTRAFRETSVLINIEELNTCERRLWEALRNTDKDAIRALMEPYLTNKEISKLLLRRDKLIKHFEKRIKKHGEDKVLYDLKSNS